MTITINLWVLPLLLWTVFCVIGAWEQEDLREGFWIWFGGAVLLLATRFLP